MASGIRAFLGAMFTKGYGVMRGVRNGLTVTLLASGMAAAEPVTVVALGDSLTAGYGLERPVAPGWSRSWRAWLKARGS
jgi:acyl-CoA thioesterase-1